MKADPYFWETQEQRKRLAKRLYGEGWTMQRIAAVLKTSQPTITRDLAGFILANKPPRPMGGRPKGRANSLFAPDKPAPAAVHKPAPAAIADQISPTTLAQQAEPEPDGKQPAVTVCSFCDQEFDKERVLDTSPGWRLLIYPSSVCTEIGICFECARNAFRVLQRDGHHPNPRHVEKPAEDWDIELE